MKIEQDLSQFKAVQSLRELHCDLLTQDVVLLPVHFLRHLVRMVDGDETGHGFLPASLRLLALRQEMTPAVVRPDDRK